jgi:hypothetical protein
MYLTQIGTRSKKPRFLTGFNLLAFAKLLSVASKREMRFALSTYSRIGRTGNCHFAVGLLRGMVVLHG